MDDATRQLFNLPPWIKVEDTTLQFTLSYPQQSHINPNLLDLNFDILINIGQVYQAMNVEPPNITFQLDGSNEEFRSLVSIPPYSARCHVQRYDKSGNVINVFSGSIWILQVAENINITLVF